MLRERAIAQSQLESETCYQVEASDLLSSDNVTGKLWARVVFA